MSAHDAAVAAWIDEQLDNLPPLEAARADRLSRLLFGGNR